jgi:hypothetical protein
LALGKAGAQVLVHYGRAESEADAVVNQTGDLVRLIDRHK